MADLVFALIIIVAVFIGRYTGFLRGVVNLICVAVSAIGGYLLYPYVSSFLVATPLFETIRKPINEYVINNYYNGSPIENLNQLFIKYDVTTIEDLFIKISEGITLVAINVISILLVFLLLRFALGFVKGITSFITKLPIIKGLDRTLGVIVSVISSVIIVYLVVAVMMIPPCNKTEISKSMCEYIDESVITKHVMDYNIFINYDSLSEMGIRGDF